MRQVPLNTQAEFHAPLRDPTIPDSHIVSGTLYSPWKLSISYLVSESGILLVYGFCLIHQCILSAQHGAWGTARTE